MKALVTGGSGFIGSNLIRRLTNEGIDVTNYDYDQGDRIEDSANLQKFVKNKFDIIFHLAGISGSRENEARKERVFKINSLATIKLCEQIIQISPKTKLVLSSSRLEYGKPKYLPVDELHPTLPLSTYGLSKLVATQAALYFHYSYKLKVTIFRTSNVYGPHPQEEFKGYNLVNRFIDLAKKNHTLNVFGDGKQLRDYLYIDDLTDAFMLSLLPQTNGQIYNLGYGEGLQLQKMASLILEQTRKGKIKFLKWPQDYKEVETGDYVSDISKIHKHLGFLPKISFEQGIKKALEKPNRSQ